MKNIKYKQVCRVQIFGDDDTNTLANSVYQCAFGIQSVTINNGGNYLTAPNVSFVGGGALVPASGTVVLDNVESVDVINITNGGTGYLTAPIVSITGGGGTGAAATASFSAGSVTGITITTNGTGYTTAPTISFIPSGITTLATATATISGGSVTAITVTVAGLGYTSTPNVCISGGGGTGATATAVTASTTIFAININSGGTGYTSAPTITIGCTTLATATAVIGYIVKSITLTNPGINYQYLPTIVFSGGTGLGGATATAVGGFNNAKRMRFNLNGSLAHIKLSQNARCIVECCNIPTFSNMGGKYALLRLVTSTQDAIFDTKKFLYGNAILLSLFINSTANASNTLYNASEFFYNINVPSNFLQQGYIDMELECPSQQSATIDFFTGKPLSTFYINLIIIDEDMELTKDSVLAPPLDYKYYNINVPIKPY